MTGRSRTFSLLWDESLLKVIPADLLTLREKSLAAFVSLASLAFILEEILPFFSTHKQEDRENVVKVFDPVIVPY